MTKRKYFSWTDEKRAELREFVDTHEKELPEAMKEAAILFGVSVGSCNGAYRYTPQKPIVTEVDPSEVEKREGRTLKTKSKVMYMETEFDNMEAEKHPLEAEVERLNHEIVKLREEKQQMLQDMMNFAKSAVSVFTTIEFGTGQITMHDIDYQLHTLVRTLNYRYGQKPE